jgi:hypothetical protein
MVDGAEFDALSRWKNFFHWNAGVRKKIKRQFNKRVRKQVKQNLDVPGRECYHVPDHIR